VLRRNAEGAGERNNLPDCEWVGGRALTCSTRNKLAAAALAYEPDYVPRRCLMSNPKSTASIAGHPIHPMLVPFPIAFFVATLACDLMFLRSDDPMWVTATLWLLAAGVVMALLAALAGLTDFLSDSRIRALSIAWLHFLGNLLVVLIEAFNWYERWQSGPDAVMQTGLVLSILAVLLMLVTGWLGWEMVYRRRVGIADTEIV
jgi:uncharacterized membrane protein